MNLKDLEIYKLAREISKIAWECYKNFDWETKKTIGNQFITAIDSIGANIAEGFGRFHYLDKNKFNYNARGSLLESIHWTEVLFERVKITEKQSKELSEKLIILNCEKFRDTSEFFLLPSYFRVLLHYHLSNFSSRFVSRHIAIKRVLAF